MGWRRRGKGETRLGLMRREREEDIISRNEKEKWNRRALIK